MHQIVKIEIPAYAELSVNNLYSKLKDHVHLKMHLPDYNDNVLPDKQFFYPLISTLFPKEVIEIVKEARKKRSLEKQENDDELIKLAPNIKEEIDQLLLHPSKITKF